MAKTEPLYRRISNDLRQQILEGRVRPGARLPSEIDLASQYGVSSITSRRALQELADDGLVVRRPGIGTLVLDRTRRPPVSGTLESALENFIVQSWNQTYDVVRFEMIAPPEEVRRALAISKRTKMNHAVSVASRESVKSHVVETYIPHDLGRHFTRQDLGNTASIVLLMQYGVIIGRVDQKIAAVPAPAWIADLLDEEAGAPLLRAIVCVCDLEGRGVDYVISHFRSEVYEYHAVMVRGGLVRT